MAPEKDPQQSSDASNSKRKGKEIAMPVPKKIKDGNCATSKSVADDEDEEILQVDTDSSSESDIEFVAEDLDPWNRAALQYYQEVLSKQSTGWRKWPDQESTIERVPNPEELPDEDADEEIVFDFEEDEEDEEDNDQADTSTDDAAMVDALDVAADPSSSSFSSSE